MKIDALTYKQVRTNHSVTANCIIHGDCIKVMKYIADASIDLILCDLPYGVTSCKWDSIIPFDILWKQYKRIITPNAAIVLFGSQPFTSTLILSNIDWFKYELIWNKNTASGFLNAKIMPLKAHENILVYSPGKHIYNPQMSTGYKKNNSATRTKPSDCYGKSKDSKYVGSTERYPTTIQEFDTVKNDSKQRVHPTQKPVLLLEYLIKTYSNEGATILDNTMGSGSTGVAALKTNRKFIGIEKEKTYYDIAHNRIREIPRRIL